MVQHDDLDGPAAAQPRPVSFLILRTSPGQTWLAVADGNADFARRLSRGMSAILGASGVNRLSCCLNVKEHYPAGERGDDALLIN
jgi:hypothetical protein